MNKDETALRGLQVMRSFRSGDVVFIESEHILTKESHERLAEHFKAILAPHGVQVILLTQGFRVVGTSLAPPKIPMWLLSIVILAGAAGGVATVGLLLTVLKDLN